ncbi:hypothetical protein Tco_1393644 [Tanacetum coccineum]
MNTDVVRCVGDESSMEDDQLAMGRVCILTDHQNKIVDTVDVRVDGNKFGRKDENEYWVESDGDGRGEEDDKMNEEIGDSLSELILETNLKESHDLWRRDLFLGKELEDLENFDNIILGLSLQDGVDGWTWSLDSGGSLLVSILRSCTDSLDLSCSDPTTLWNKLIPKKINPKINENREKDKAQRVVLSGSSL